jgi:hypothetical protein
MMTWMVVLLLKRGGTKTDELEDGAFMDDDLEWDAKKDDY